MLPDRPACAAACLLVALLLLAPTFPTRPAAAAEIVPVGDFGSNPGRLVMLKRVPDGVAGPIPLVVVLHGCQQDGRGYAAKAGWIALSDALRFALLMPEQTASNNGFKCFNWFEVLNNARDRGEALSIRQMIDRMKAEHAIDPKRVFVTGLSAGGAMANVMLAAYPDVFAAGAVVAGVPYGCASNLSEAKPCMDTARPGAASWTGWFCAFAPWLCPAGSSGEPPTPKEWGDRVRQASGHAGPFPRVSIWHGTADNVVKPVNAEALVRQWTDVHNLPPGPGAEETVMGRSRRVFRDAAGIARVELYTIAGMAHGMPVDPGPGPEQCGSTDAFVLDADICASRLIARFWGLAD